MVNILQEGAPFGSPCPGPLGR